MELGEACSNRIMNVHAGRKSAFFSPIMCLVRAMPSILKSELEGRFQDAFQGCVIPVVIFAMAALEISSRPNSVVGIDPVCN